MDDLISVVVPVYNVENYLEECVQSILAQTYKHIEILLVDDGSTDGSGALCERLAEMDKRIQVIHQQNRGLSGARNTGLRYASGEYVLFIDSDDTILPEMVERLAEKAKAADADVVCCNEALSWPDGRIEPMHWYRGGEVDLLLNSAQERAEAIAKCYLSELILFSACNKLYRLRLIQENDLHFSEGAVVGEDFGFSLVYLLYARKVVGIPEAMYLYRMREGSIMNSGGFTRICIDDFVKYLYAWKLRTDALGVKRITFYRGFIKAMDNQYRKRQNRTEFQNPVQKVEQRAFYLNTTIQVVLRPWLFLQVFGRVEGPRKWRDHAACLKYLLQTGADTAER